MKILDHNVLYRDHILSIVYSFILPRSILSQAIISTRITWESKIDSEQRPAMAEPPTSLHTWTGSIILSVVLLDISARLYAAIILFPFLKNHRINYKEAKSSTRDIMTVEVVVRNK